ncbi:MAG: hypothetical protein IJ220_03750 [Clostridia bacterium]|nr:hypothetical protein [Clostridia bacterium]
MPIFNVTPTFLYPHSRQYPFDEVAEKIVRELQKRNFKVPGITVEFDYYGSGEAKYQHVYRVIGNSFKLTFMRVQGKLTNSWNDIAALYEICIPKQVLKVYDDESGPTYYLYVGNDWKADKTWFMNNTKMHAKLAGVPKKYLKYTGECHSRIQNGRAQTLVVDTDLNREYAPQGEEPESFSCSEKMNEFTTWLQENVLQYILTFSVSEIVEMPRTMEKLIPYSGPWSAVYSICDSSDAEKIEKAKKDINSLMPEKRYALAPNRRLVSFDVPCYNRFPKIAYDGFIWCDVNQGEKVTKYNKFMYEVENAMLNFFDSSYYILTIRPKYANHVFVVDNFPFEETRQNLFQKIAPRERLTDEEIGNAYAARGATIIPITEYKGGYKEPIVLINRELDFDEVEIIKQIRRH